MSDEKWSTKSAQNTQGDGGWGNSLPHSMNISIIEQSFVGPSVIQSLVQIQDIDLYDQLAKKLNLFKKVDF